MFKRLITAITGDPNEKVLKPFRQQVTRINELEKDFEKKSNDELRNMTAQFQQRIRSATEPILEELEGAQQQYVDVLGTDDQKFARVEVERIRKDLLAAETEILDEILPEAFAAVREASKRTTGLRHYDVQMLGGMVLNSGRIAEMKTGEGKTLVATLPLYLNALAGRGAHLVTPNDYLSKVGLQLMGPIYQLLGLTAAVIQNSAGNPDSGSFQFDPDFPTADDRFLSLRPISRAEAYRCDITYGTNNEYGFDYLRDNMASELPRCVQRELHYAIVDEVDNILIDEARTPLIISGEARESANYYQIFAGLVKSLQADVHYVLNEKDRVATLSEEGINFVEKRMGLTNLYDTEHFDLIPYLDNALRAHALYRRDKDYIVRNSEVIIVDEFTGRLMEGRRYSEGLHQAIEAKEGVKVQKESMTLATVTFQNFFRMYNKLAGMTGTAKTEEEEFQKIYSLDVVQIPTYRPVVRKDEPDLVYRSEDAKFKAVLDEVVEANKRKQPILLGTTAVETSERVSEMLKRRGVEHQVLNAKNHEREATIIAQAGRPSTVTIATNMAGRGVDILLGGNAENLARDLLRREETDLALISQHDWNDAVEMLKRGQDPVAKYQAHWAEVLAKKWVEAKRDAELVRSVGGLYVIGTERHEARRIDNQLRGRSGRLGDPGMSRFYISMEDELMRRFGGERMSGLMSRLGLEEDVPIEAGVVSKAIESAQTKVEGFNFDIRKHVLQYDEVVNEQRNRIYEQRRRILTELSMQQSVVDMIGDEISGVVGGFTSAEYEEDWQLEELAQAIKALFPVPDHFSADRWKGKTQDQIEEDCVQMGMDAYAAKEKLVGETAMRNVEKQIMLWAVDNRWVHHLTDLDRLREGIGLRAYGQMDPLVSYRREAFEMYSDLIGEIRSDIIKAIFAFQVQRAPTAPPQPAAVEQNVEDNGESTPELVAVRPVINTQPIARNIRTNRGDGGAPVSQTIRKTGTQLGRNDMCWCNSGKKYKNCHMQSDLKGVTQPQKR